jgi:hypothetical protein
MSRVSLWSTDNLFAWGVPSCDDVNRTLEEHAEMLARVGFPSVALDWHQSHAPTLERHNPCPEESRD